METVHHCALAITRHNLLGIRRYLRAKMRTTVRNFNCTFQQEGNVNFTDAPIFYLSAMQISERSGAQQRETAAAMKIFKMKMIQIRNDLALICIWWDPIEPRELKGQVSRKRWHTATHLLNGMRHCCYRVRQETTINWWPSWPGRRPVGPGGVFHSIELGPVTTAPHPRTSVSTQ